MLKASDAIERKSLLSPKISVRKINGVWLNEDVDSVIISNHISNQLAGSRGLTHSPCLPATALSHPGASSKMLTHIYTILHICGRQTHIHTHDGEYQSTWNTIDTYIVMCESSVKSESATVNIQLLFFFFRFHCVFGCFFSLLYILWKQTRSTPTIESLHSRVCFYTH